MSPLIELDRQVEWPMQMLRSEVHNTQLPSVAFAEVHGVLPALAWLHKDALIERLDAEIDAEADDKASLSHEARQQQEAELMGDLLAVERDESALAWSAMAQKLPVEHRADINPVALLGVRLVTAPRADISSGTSPMHVITFGGAR